MTRQLLCDERSLLGREIGAASQRSAGFLAIRDSRIQIVIIHDKAIREPLAGNQAKVPRASVILLRKHCAGERQDLAVWLALSVPGGSGPRD